MHKTFYLNNILKPLAIISYPVKGVRIIRINGFNCLVIDDLLNTKFYGQKTVKLKTEEEIKKVSELLSIPQKIDYINFLKIDYQMCSFK
jgi:hypothetical protein